MIRPLVQRWAEDGAQELGPDVLLHGLGDLDAEHAHDGSVHDLEEVFASFSERPPSYVQALHETKRRMALVGRLGIEHPWWTINGKYAGYRFAAEMGISHPEILGRFASIAEVEPETLGNRFLIKPEGGSTNRGIFGLDRQPNGSFIDRLSGDSRTWAEVTSAYNDLVRGGMISKNLIVEELLRKPGSDSAIPDDFKVYCFYDRAELIMQRDLSPSANRNPRRFRLQRSSDDPSNWRFKFWNRDWEDLGPIKYADRVDGSLAPPANAEELIATAERLGKALRVPFARLDFYDTERGVVFGEVTLNPGPPEIFAPEVDEYLGRHREFAAARLLAEDVRAGHWDHLLPPSP
jgi:hypothetical protein